MCGKTPGTCSSSGVCAQYFLVEANGGAYPCDFLALGEWQSINSPGADTADKTVNLTFDPLIVFLLHIILKVFACKYQH